MRHPLKLALALFVGLVALALSPTPAKAQEAGGPQAGSLGLLDEIRRRGVIRVGVSLFQPWAMRGADGRLIGFEIDVARRLAVDIGVELDHQVMDFQHLVPALREGAIDIIVSGFSITPQRALEVAFSVPYAESGITLVANTRASGLFDEFEDFNDPDVRIAVLGNSTSEGVANAAFPEAVVLPLNNQEEVSAAVLTGRATAAVASSPWPELETLRHSDKLFIPLKEPLVVTGEAFAVRRGDPDFIGYLNSWIAFRSLDRWLARTYAQWFRSLDWEEQLPPGETRAAPLTTTAE